MALDGEGNNVEESENELQGGETGPENQDVRDEDVPVEKREQMKKSGDIIWRVEKILGGE